ncbi:hypothetical protein WN66_02339 [Saccharomyces cerevisiae]|uniref:Putative uncharacterized protein YGL063C-A n=2 Tax=Saccharomyces cerevisiae TaxID=4932 RepID=YG063_YEAST|nr:RecName: Full=Putative uncharacterized protein YGL063C-A [Saccharomyces cerevisiae S288C]AAL79262.1 unknown [Saccharomyces cerevisiae]KZV11164.1 hypothetical protein WN66_02339 [Saccharomyces cerevisiae]CAY79700.1 EC1118_1G1_2289p [Saccharomyces cerevisiae EC1118]
MRSRVISSGRISQYSKLRNLVLYPSNTGPSNNRPCAGALGMYFLGPALK